MKKLSLIFFFLISAFISFSQVNIQPDRAYINYNFRPPLDTIYSPVKLGEIRSTVVGDSVFLYGCISLTAPKKWQRIGGTSSTNIGGGEDGNNYPTGLSYNSFDNMLTLTRYGLPSLSTLIPSNIYDGSETKLISGSDNVLITGTGTTSSPYVVSAIIDGNYYTTSLSYAGQTLTMNRNGLSPLSVVIPQDGNNFVSNLTFIGNTLTLSRTGLSPFSVAIPPDGNNYVLELAYLDGRITLQRDGLTPLTIDIPVADSFMYTSWGHTQHQLDSLAALTKTRVYYSSDSSISVIKRFGLDQDSIDIQDRDSAINVIFVSSSGSLTFDYLQGLQEDTIDVNLNIDLGGGVASKPRYYYSSDSTISIIFKSGVLEDSVNITSPTDSAKSILFISGDNSVSVDFRQGIEEDTLDVRIPPLEGIGDNWGLQFAYSDGTVKGDGLIGNPLRIDTIADFFTAAKTRNYIRDSVPTLYSSNGTINVNRTVNIQTHELSFVTSDGDALKLSQSNGLTYRPGTGTYPYLSVDPNSSALNGIDLLHGSSVGNRLGGLRVLNGRTNYVYNGEPVDDSSMVGSIQARSTRNGINKSGFIGTDGFTNYFQAGDSSVFGPSSYDGKMKPVVYQWYMPMISPWQMTHKYYVDSLVATKNGSETRITPGVNITMSGLGTLASPYIINSATGGVTGVTSIGMTVPSAFSVSPSTITTSGVFNLSALGNTGQYIRGDGSLFNFPTIPTYDGSETKLLAGANVTLSGLGTLASPYTITGKAGTITGVSLSMPSAFTVLGSPFTSGSGVLQVLGAGTTNQYIRGDGSLATFPIVSTYDGSETKIIPGTNITSITGSGTILSPYVVNAATQGSGTGTVTSIGLTAFPGINVSNSTITTSGVIGLSTTLNGLLYGTGSGFAAGSVTSPLSFSGGILSMSQAGVSNNGWLSSGNWNLFNDKQQSLQFRDENINLGVSGSTSILNFTGTGVTASESGGIVTVNIPGSVGGVADGNNIVNGVSVSAGTLTLNRFELPDLTTSFTADAVPNGITNQYFTNLLARSALSLTTSNNNGASTYNSTTGVFNIPNYTLAGLGGEPIITSGTTSQYWRGDKTWQVLNTTAIIEGDNLYYSDSRARNSLSATSPLFYNNSTGVFTIQQGTTSLNGYISSTDWNTFNTKQQPLQFQNSSVNIGTSGVVSTIDVTGSATASYSAGKVTINVPASTSIQYQDEAVNQGAAGAVNNINFTGVGVTSSYSSGTLTVVVPGGGTVGDNNFTTSTTITDGLLTTSRSGLTNLTAVINTSLVPEGSRLYYTDARSRAALSLTNVGSSGASTYSSATGVFNIPNYTLSGLGGVATSRTISINGVVQDLSANRIWSVGTVTSVGLITGTTGTDINVTASPVTSTGNITLNIPTASSSVRGALSSTDWSLFNGKQNPISLTTVGSSGVSTLVGTVINVPNYTLAGLGGEPIITSGTVSQYWRGDKTWQTLNSTVVPEGTNQYFTTARARTSISATSPLLYNNTTGVASIQQANGSQSGYLSSTDWSNFDGKQSKIQYQDESVNIGTLGVATTIDFTGGGVTSSYSLGKVTVNIPSSTLIQYQDEAVNTGSAGAVSTINFTGVGVTSSFNTGVLTVAVTAGSDLNNFTSSTVMTDGVLTTARTGLANLTANFSTSVIPEGSRLYYTDARSRTAHSLTTLGTSGISTYNNLTGVLNVPNYTLAGLGGEPLISGGTVGTYWRGDKTWQILSTNVVTEGTNQYFTNARSRASVSLTTLGNSGLSTYSNLTGVFNIPNYTLAGLGGEPLITAGSTGQFWRGDKTWQTINSGNVVESGNLYFTNVRARTSISLTTLGTSGASTYNSTTGVFNVPNYSIVGLGGVPSGRILTINGVAQNLSLNRSWSVGTVTSVGLIAGTVGTDINVSGSPIINSGVLTLNIPTASASARGALSSANWTTFNNKQNAISLTTTGTSGLSTFIGSVLNIPNYTLAGLGGEPLVAPGTINQYYRGDKTWQTLNTTAVIEGTNLYYTNVRARAAFSYSGPLTYNSGTGAVGINVATSVQDGYLTAANFNTFNTKQGAIQYKDENINLGTSGSVTTFDITGAGVTASYLSNKLTLNIPGATNIQYQDEAVNTGTPGAITSLNFTGAGVTSVFNAGTLTVTVPGGGTGADGNNFTSDFVLTDGLFTLSRDGLVNLTEPINTSLVPEGSRLYYTDARARSAISLTTTGNSGSSTYSSLTGILNVPTYTLAGLGGEPIITAGTVSQVWLGNKTWATLNTALVLESGNLYFTNARARTSISLTTLSSSGAATYNNLTGVLNVPNYTLTGLGGVATSRILTINGVAQDLSTNRTWSVGTVTSVGLVGGTGTSIVGTTITGAGSFTINNTGVLSNIASTGISVSSATGNVTITNTAPDRIVSITGSNGNVVTGTYPNFNVAAPTVASSVYGSKSTITPATNYSKAYVKSYGASWEISDKVLKMGHGTLDDQRTITINATLYIDASNFSVGSFQHVGTLPTGYIPSGIITFELASAVPGTGNPGTTPIRGSDGVTGIINGAVYSSSTGYIDPSNGNIYVRIGSLTAAAPTLSGTSVVVIPIVVTYFINVGI